MGRAEPAGRWRGGRGASAGARRSRRRGDVACGTRAHGGGPRGWASRGGGPPGPDGMVGFLSERLDLTAAQRDSVRAILERHRADLEKIWREVHTRFDSVRSAMSAEINAQLTPAQRPRYAELERRLERPPRFGGGPPWAGKPRPRP